MIKPINRKIAVFVVRERQKLYNNSGLYTANSSRGVLTRAEDIWVISAASDCVVHSWEKGQHLLISDGFELDAIDDNPVDWETMKDDPAFTFMREFAEKVEGTVRSGIIHENSVIGAVEGDVIQTDTMW